MTSIPIIDLEKLQNVDNFAEHPDNISIATEIREGLGKSGFLYLVNHGISQEVVSQVHSQSHQFFSLDPSVKLNYNKDTSVGDSGLFDFDKYAGFTSQGVERLHADAKLELKETFDWMDGRGKYPDVELPHFESSIARLDKECKSFLKNFLRLLAISLELKDENFFLNCCRHFDDPVNYRGIYNIRLIHYPPIESDADSDQVKGSVRCGEHSDYIFITLLFQDDAGGLEVKNVNGEWIEAKPIPGSIVVNTGNLTEFWTSGIFPATPHRVVIPDVHDAKRSKSRYSVAFFNGPDYHTMITPMDLNQTPDERKRLEKSDRVYEKVPINAYDYVMGLAAKMYSYK